LKTVKAVSVRTFEPASLSPQRKLEIAADLGKYLAEVDRSRKTVSDEEAMRSARPSYHPHQ
jgi:hypothetical protein